MIFADVCLMISVIEHLPQELRDRFTEMREMDLGVQSMYHLIRVKNNANKMTIITKINIKSIFRFYG